MTAVFPSRHGGNFKDLAGQLFTRLTVVSYAGKRGASSLWLCRCTCGNEKHVTTPGLIKGNTKSCGCLNKELNFARRYKHGMNGTPEYLTWQRLKSRCLNPKSENWEYYGGRGITVCDRWKDSFINFYADMGNRPSDQHSIDRIDTNGPYSPENCRWTTKEVQIANRRPLRPQDASKLKPCNCERVPHKYSCPVYVRAYHLKVREQRKQQL